MTTQLSADILPLFSIFDETSLKNDGLVETNLLSLSYGRIVPKDIASREGLLPESYETYQIVEPGQIILRLTDMQNDQKSFRTGLVRERGIITSAYCALRPKDTYVTYAEFFDYLFHSIDTSKRLYSLGGGVRQSLKFDDIKRMSIKIPKPAVRDRIVRFLDEETAKIDNLIKKYERLLELSAAQAETRWHQLFAGLSMHPERPLKRVLQKVTRPAFAGEGVITAFRDGQVTLRANRREEGFTFSDTEDGYQGIKPGDLVYHGLDGFAGAVGVSDSHGNGSPVYHVCRPLDEQDSVHFMAAYLRFLGLSGFLATQAPNVRQRSVDFRNWETFSRIPMRVPSRREQDEIVTRLEEFKTSRETTEELTQRAIALLRERRSALITAAVTGQIEV